ncbi:MAG TPA: GH116 family glycosyl-hydrolase, partial [Roseimicrobium sp.]|nr:GH116 family glycosyl-hydrolase [Roseimicrobium sp.]
FFHEPLIFSAIAIKGAKGTIARVLQGPIPSWKVMFPWGDWQDCSGNGGRDKTFGLPGFANASFLARFPFGQVSLTDPAVPLTVEVTGWSPFTPGNSDDASLPVAGVEYTFTNRTSEPIEAVYSFHARNFTRDKSFEKLPKDKRPADGVRRSKQGFILYQNGSAEKPGAETSFAASTDAPGAIVNCRWFRGGWFDSLTLVWKSIAEMQTPSADAYTEGDPSTGGSFYVPLKLAAGETKTIRLQLAWYSPLTNLRAGKGVEESAEKTTCGCGPEGCAPKPPQGHRPWYVSKFSDVEAVDSFWRANYVRLRKDSKTFADCFYDTTLPPEVVEAVAANLSILKSPTVARQPDGRAWLWEGCFDDSGCCHGSCTHVWNYAQALAHLFPDLERSLRDSEFVEDQDEKGHQSFRTPLPIRPEVHDFHAAADGQLGGIMKIYRDWKVSGDTAWLKRLWPRVKQSLNYCIATWDPDHEGLVKEPHHNTYDIEFWGPDGMCGSFYAGALKAGSLIGKALNDPTPLFDELYVKAKHQLETTLFDGEYFIQDIRWTDLHASSPVGTQNWNVNYS